MKDEGIPSFLPVPSFYCILELAPRAHRFHSRLYAMMTHSLLTVGMNAQHAVGTPVPPVPPQSCLPAGRCLLLYSAITSIFQGTHNGSLKLSMLKQLVLWGQLIDCSSGHVIHLPESALAVIPADVVFSQGVWSLASCISTTKASIPKGYPKKAAEAVRLCKMGRFCCKEIFLLMSGKIWTSLWV